ncbi:MAG: dihydropteroate synthase [Planctomycetia bacterium]|nr:dihydropteroate synthase [Candidatus Brocadia sp.]QOJ07488.1 MAG: dihydropteroate synthase [Planctomycetia bacterium]HQU30794.1 dihydropteroate synthase [Candidatus Brocadia sapporoensis]
MISIGERINGMFKDVREAIKNKDPKAVRELAIKQTEAGASFLDVNVGTAAADPAEAMKWLVEVVQDTVKTPIAIDSQKFDVVKAGLSVAKNEILINSSKGDPEELDKFMTLAKEYNASLICLTMDKTGIPQDVARRMEFAMKIVEKAVEHEFELSKVYIDPVLFPINVDQKQPALMFDIFNQIKMISDPPPHRNVGLSNFSQGTKEKRLLARVFLTMGISYGLDAAVMDVLDNDLMDAAITAEIIMNQHLYSDSYLTACRK